MPVSPRYPSRFLLDIDERHLELTKPRPEGLIAEARAYIAALDRSMPENRAAGALPAGTRVRHAVFGPGTVEGIDPDRAAHIVRFDGLPTPRAISFRARLEICS